MKSFLKRFWHHVSSTFNHYGWLSLVIVPILALVNWSYFSVVNAEKATLESQQVSLANEKINIIDFIISNALTNTYNDMQVMSDADEMQFYLDHPEEVNLDDVEQLFYRITNNKPQFSSVEFLNMNGDQLILLNRINQELIIIPTDELSSRSEESYFDHIGTITDKKLYIVPLYMENEIINNITVTKPITTLIVSVFNNEGVKSGYIVLDYDANYLLSVFETYVSGESEFIELGVINEESVWGITTGFNEALGLGSTIDDEFYDNLEIYGDSLIRSYVNLSGISNIDVYNSDDFYEIFAVIDFDQVFKEYGGFAVRNPFLIYFVNALSFIIIYIFGWLLKSKGDDRILLNTNMYLSDKNNDGVLITNDKGEITYTNEAFEDIYGYKLDKIKGLKPSKVLGNLNFGIKGAVMKSKQIFSKNVWNINHKGIYVLKHLRIKPETNANGNIKHFLAIYSSPQVEVESLAFASNFDAIETYKLFAKAFENEELKVNKSAAMVIRTFNEKNRKLFTSLNKNNGSPYALADFLKSNLGSKFKIAVPKESYVMIYVSLDLIDETLQDTIDFIDNLIDKYKHQPNINSDLEYNFGIALADNKTITKADVIENAFIALQMSKTRKNIKHLIYSDEIKKIIKREKDIYAQLDHGFNFDEFYLLYQIQKDIKRNSFTGVEALLRWNNSLLGNISPGEFISIIENSFYINRLSIMVVNKVIKDFTPYVEYINKDFRISINLTYFDFFNDYIIQNLVDIIEKSAIPSKNFCFEITESGYLENQDKTNAIIDFLHSKDITVAIDDFGTGFSSLEVLKNIHIDKVKIDRSFIKDYPEKDDGAMFKTVVSLVKNMNLEVLVEGTETKEQVDFSLANGCDEIQGYYISQPIYIENLVRKYLNKKADF
ncbi:MAG: EAL domain-containing protein [Candidatus Izemoplasmatales bacterium]|nr:EAL domain-containing protein [Candidatus Izemoplasmatales bacterium]